MAPQNSYFVSLLFLLSLPFPSQLYTLHNCSFDSTNQQKINCDYRQLSEMPSDVPKFTVILSVIHNNLTSLRQNDLAGLGKLQALHLGYNQIWNTDDGAFLHSPGLRRLSLHHNRFTNLTDETFRGLSNLTYLNLRNNPIKLFSKFAFGHLKNLKELDLWGVFLFQITDTANIASSCPMLQVLNLGYNNLASFEYENFPLSLNMTDLDLSLNPLSRFTLHSNIFPRLQSLSLSYIWCQLQWDVSDKAFLKNLKTLDLTGTNFTIETYKLIFKSAVSVTNLILSRVFIAKSLLPFTCEILSLQKLSLQTHFISVLNDSLLQPCASITDLDLRITDLSRSSLRMLVRLSRLGIESNDLTQVPKTIRNMSSLTYLSIASNGLTQLDCMDFSGLWLLAELDLSYNSLEELNSCVFWDLRNLETLSITGNYIAQFDNSFSVMFPSLLVLNAESNDIDWLQDGVFKKMSHLRELTIGIVFALDDRAFAGLTDLRFLSYSTSFEAGTGLGLERFFSSRFIYLPLLQTLKITLTDGMCVHLEKDVLQGLGNLTVFSSSNLFCKPHSEMFRKTPHLQHLAITKNDDLNNLDSKLFQPLGHLETLNLSQNHLKSLDFLSEANLTKLETLILADNELRVINASVFETLPSLKYLDLWGNPFVCDCSNADFIQWVLRGKQVYVVNAFQYRCAYPLSQEGQLLLAFNVRSCWEFAEFVGFISSFSLVLLTLLSSLIYHFLRWQLVYGYHLLRAFLYDGKKRRQGCAELYDAFVSYSVHDEEWVYNELMPELEERQGWRLCLHDRDFMPGKAILENITDAIYSSRKTLCVISRQYLLSEWCSREIQMASFRLFDEQKDVLILLFLEEISSAELSPFYRMRKLVKSRTYLSWTRARSHRGLFWERVRQALESGNDPTDNHHDPLTANA